jgi:hypothetical protein
MTKIEVRALKGDSRAVLDTIIKYCVALGQPLIQHHRGIFDEADSHYTKVWMTVPGRIDVEDLFNDLHSRFDITEIWGKHDRDV